MAIISQETFDKFTEGEKEKVRKKYLKWHDLSKINPYFEGKISNMEDLFGKENLQPEPKIRTWEDVQEMNEDSNFFMRIDDNLELSDKVYSKCIAALQIAKLIELGYGGMVTEKEWKDSNIEKYCVYSTLGKIHYDGFNTYDYRFIAFHTSEQRKEFMSYPENVKLVEQYYMI